MGGVTPPPENKLSANEGICRQKKKYIPHNVKLYSLHSRAILAYNKEKWDKLCKFCEKLCSFVNFGKLVLCLEKWGGGGRSSKMQILHSHPPCLNRLATALSIVLVYMLGFVARRLRIA